MTDEEMIRGLDATIEALIKRHATSREAEDTIRALYRDTNEETA